MNRIFYCVIHLEYCCSGCYATAIVVARCDGPFQHFQQTLLDTFPDTFTGDRKTFTVWCVTMLIDSSM